MRRWDPLNARQLAILKRVAEGDELTAAEPGARRSASALGDRGLVKVSKRHGTWQASVTDAGRFYLEQGCHPEHPSAPSAALDGRRSPRRSTPRARSSRVAAASAHGQPAADRTKRPPPHATAAIAERRRVAARDLMADLVADPEHVKIIESPDEAATAEWRRIVDFAKRHGLVPTGKRVEKSTELGDLCIRLRDGEHPNTRTSTVGLPDVPMPTELRSLHPVVKAMQNDPGRLDMPDSLRRRCLLYLHGLTTEAALRGYQVQEHPIDGRHRNRINTYGRPGVPDYRRREGQLEIVHKGFSFTVTIDQQHPQADDLDRFNQLAVTMCGHPRSHGARYRWADGKRSTIEQSVPAVLRELETRADEAARHQADRRAAWQQAMDEATHLATQAQYAAVFDQQAANWRKASDLRQYCAAVEQHISRAEEAGQPVDDARRWLAWAREYTDRIDPLQELPGMPTPTLRPGDLEPFLDGWSPYGPEEDRRRPQIPAWAR